MSKNKSKFLIPAVGAAVIVVGSIAGYMYFKGGPSGDAKSVIASAKVLPSTTLMATYITTDSLAWSKLQQFGTPQAQSVFAKGLEKFNQDSLAKSNISYEKDIKPWVGGVMIGLLPPNPTKPVQFTVPSATPNLATPTQRQEPNFLLVVGIKDKLSALNFQNKLKAQKDLNTKEIDYKGEKIAEITSNGKPIYSTVLNDNYVALAPQQQAVEQAIDTAKGSPSFASKEEVSSIINKGVDIQNPVAQIYVPDYGNAMQQLIASDPRTQLPAQTLKQLKQLKSMVVGVGIDDTGVRLKAVGSLDPQLSKFRYENTSANIVGHFPADTIALVNGQGISHWWSTFTEQSKDYPQLNESLQQTRQQLKTVNIDLDKDIFGWMDGEFGLAFIPSNQGVLAPLGFGAGLVFKTSDSKTAQATLTKLDDLAKARQVNITQKNIGGKNITEWEIPQQGALLAHGLLDDNTIFLALGEPVANALITSKNPSLDNSQNFKAVTGSLQKPNGGYFYLNMDQTTPVINRLASFSQSITPETLAILSSIRGVGVTAISPDNSTSKFEMMLALKPKTN